MPKSEAIEEHPNLYEWQVQAIQDGIKQIDQGKTIDFSHIKAHWNFYPGVRRERENH